MNLYINTLIHYIIILEKEEPLSLYLTIPPTSLTHNLIKRLGRFPHNIIHFIYGYEYYEATLQTGGYSGYYVDFVYYENVKDLDGKYINPNALNIFFICTEDRDKVIDINIELSRSATSNCIYYLDQKNKDIFKMPRACFSEEEVWNELYNEVFENLGDVDHDGLLKVPMWAGLIDNRSLFIPSNVNKNVLNSMVGNWQYVTTIPIVSNEDIDKEQERANKNSRIFARQQVLVNQIEVFYQIEKQLRTQIKDKCILEDQFYSPLIVILPYMHLELYKNIGAELKKNNYDISILKYIKKVLKFEESENYIFYSTNSQNKSISIDLIQTIGTVIEKFITQRIEFLDFIGLLHASIKFSPCVRLPMLGNSINKELSFVGINLVNQLYLSKNKKSFIHTIQKIGKKIAEKTVSKELKEIIKNEHSQIFAISDLPIEWIDIDGIPLGFTHDICRIPEIPITGGLAQYERCFLLKYKVPKDILKKTLVVYGCRQDNFKIFQDMADERANELGFQTCQCLSKTDFVKSINEYKPEFLIIDSHGGTNLHNHESFMMMGDDYIYPKDIVENNIKVPLVFISACNIAPTYNTINTIANAFFEMGSLSVTSSYMPLDVKAASILYLRILNQLNYASQHFVHKNWLAFISHLLRTSYIHDTIGRVSDLDFNNIVNIKSTILSQVLFFQNRRNIYEQLQNKEISKILHTKHIEAIPHYLMYSTLGRADLIEFECVTRCQ